LRIIRWVVLLLAVALAAAPLVEVGAYHLRDRRIRLRTLVQLDPPPAHALVRYAGHTLIVTGALVRQARPDRLVLRAWQPTPTIHVAEPGAGPVTIELENVPGRIGLRASGPVEENRTGKTRILRFAPGETRQLLLVDRGREVTFAVLGDTGDDPTFPEALRRADELGAEFLLHVGDLIYGDEQMPNIARIVAQSPIPVFIVRGNHDYRNTERIEFMRALGPPYYAFVVGGATFIVLDNAGNYLPTFWRRSTQYRWFAAILDVPREGPLFVAMHKPLFDRRPTHEAYLDDEPFATQLMRDFVRVRLDAALTGHVHDHHLWVEQGIPFVVSGEGYQSPKGTTHGQRMAVLRVRGRQVEIEQVPVWRRR
jgi:predicted phosphodiesterase